MQDSTDVPFCDSTSFPLKSVLIGGFVMVFLCSFGLFGNCLCLTVLIKKYLKDTIFRVYLYALCIADILTLVCCLFMIALPIFTEYYEWDTDVHGLVNHFVLFFYPLGTFAENVSTLLTAAISLVRLLCVKFPLQTRMLKSPQTATSIIALLLVFICLFHIPRLLELHITYCITTVSGFNRTMATIEMTSLRKSHGYKTIYMAYSNTTVMFILPFATILFCNFATMVLLLKHRLNEANMRPSVTRIHQRHEMTTKLLIFLCFSFLISHSLPFLINMLEAMDAGMKGDTYGWLVDVSNLLVAMKASCNFLLYLMFNKKFRSSFSRSADRRMAVSSGTYSEDKSKRTRLSVVY